MQSDTWEGEGQTGGLGTIRLPLGLQSAGPDLGSHHPGTTQTSAAGLVAQDSSAERKRHLSALFHQTYLRHLLQEKKGLALEEPVFPQWLTGSPKCTAQLQALEAAERNPASLFLGSSITSAVQQHTCVLCSLLSL